MRKITLAAGIGAAAVAGTLFAGVANASTATHSSTTPVVTAAVASHSSKIAKASTSPIAAWTPEQVKASEVAAQAVALKFNVQTTPVSATQIAGTDDYLVVLQKTGGTAQWAVAVNLTTLATAIKVL